MLAHIKQSHFALAKQQIKRPDAESILLMLLPIQVFRGLAAHLGSPINPTHDFGCVTAGVRVHHQQSVVNWASLEKRQGKFIPAFRAIFLFFSTFYLSLLPPSSLFLSTSCFPEGLR